MTTTYTEYTKAEVCDDCGHAPQDIRKRVCPKCGGNLTEQVGRWIITEDPHHWYDPFIGKFDHTTYHKFIVGRDNV